MKNITLSIHEDLLMKSREYALKHGTSLNNLIRRLLKTTVMTDSEKEKRDKCYEILQKYEAKVHFVVSIQALKKFTAVMIGKFKILPLMVKNIIDDISEFEVININTYLIKLLATRR